SLERATAFQFRETSVDARNKNKHPLAAFDSIRENTKAKRRDINNRKDMESLRERMVNTLSNRLRTLMNAESDSIDHLLQTLEGQIIDRRVQKLSEVRTITDIYNFLRTNAGTLWQWGERGNRSDGILSSTEIGEGTKALNVVPVDDVLWIDTDQ